MIYQLLNTMYHLNIKLEEINGKTKLVYETGFLDDRLKAQIKKHKQELIQRQAENAAARKLGFLVYDHGELYEYRYGRGAFLYIQRLPYSRASAWRENYLPGQAEAYKTKTVVHDVLFEKAFEQAVGFVEWMGGKRVDSLLL
ncbi:hypothetical protein [Cytobacillus gottheilii]|uniref:TubC N-terminal docking domain-related protein n=1 Tax=Cytobacillus gottheilii TaxID=859144 RepID=UPI00082AF250|nr:hypothetical protein [Cytobacillus gottheilii]